MRRSGGCSAIEPIHGLQGLEKGILGDLLRQGPVLGQPQAEPVHVKEVFTLRVFGELPYEKIGRLFGKSAGWARVTFYRAKVQISEHMEAMEHEGD